MLESLPMIDGATLADLVEPVEFFRVDATRQLDPKTRSKLGQFFTPPTVATMLAGMFDAPGECVKLLDAGAGVGSLTAALVEELCSRTTPPKRVDVHCYEVDPSLLGYLMQTLRLCQGRCEVAGIEFSHVLHGGDFIAAAVASLDSSGSLFHHEPDRFTAAILNPPYGKINSGGPERELLSRIGIETTNLYAAFLTLACRLLEPDGELVAITPRSFTNGPYFRPFRQEFLGTMRLRRVHVFQSRTEAFKGDEVLQENVIFHAVKSSAPRRTVDITSNAAPGDEPQAIHQVDYSELVRPNDPDRVIHLLTDEVDRETANRMARFTAALPELGLQVSTGRVVDFRTKSKLREEPGPETVPLIYPAHFGEDGFIVWPRASSRKPNALIDDAETEDLQLPRGAYVLVKRFSAKEERRRIVAAVFDPERIGVDRVGIENHLNYFHRGGQGIPLALAKGLTVFLNSTLADMFFRQFNGHTQVNASDLRAFRFPTEGQLARLGEKIGDRLTDQSALDGLIEQEFEMAGRPGRINPVKVKRMLADAMAILKAVGMPKAQQNERSALTLLALLGMKPGDSWADAQDPLIGITPMMTFFSQHYGKTYKPNSRESVRRQTVHQFLEAGLIVQNPDQPTRPTNSGATVYRIDAATLSLVRQYGTKPWDKTLAAYLENQKTLSERYARERAMQLIPVKLPDGKRLELSAGGQNVLVKAIVDEFCPRFAPGGRVLVVGDTANKWLHVDRERLTDLCVRVDDHGKFPDVVVHHVKRDWLLLIEAVTSHGPVDAKRRGELRELFTGCTAGLVYVTAFLTRKAMVAYLDTISWETEVWVAEAPSHLIHFNGERFLGPYTGDEGHR